MWLGEDPLLGFDQREGQVSWSLGGGQGETRFFGGADGKALLLAGVGGSVLLFAGGDREVLPYR